MKGSPLRVLIVSHSHPASTNGGAEIAAYRLFEALDAQDDVEAWFLGCNRDPDAGRTGVAITQPYTDKDFVYNPSGQFDWFRFANGDSRLPRELESLLTTLRPDVVHFHHYSDFGVEALWSVKQILPNAVVVLTLHEFQAICNHFGQMITTEHFNLCNRSGWDACHRCFPSVAPSEFFLRDRYIKVFFDAVDHFISPSHFLLNRYVDWGIDRSRMSVIDNLVAPASEPASEPAGSEAAPLRVGFFGQLSRLKGIGVLLECAKILHEDNDMRIIFELHGDYRRTPVEFQKELLSQLGELSSNVNYHGPYQQEVVDRLMLRVDAVLVPSIWWENSPVVIEEALRNARPVICSDIGGMAEKVRDGIDGLHFPVGSAIELSYLLRRLYANPSILAALQTTLRRPPKAEHVLSEHVRLYRRLVTSVPAIAST